MLRLFLKMLADDAHPTRVRPAESPSRQPPRPRVVDAADRPVPAPHAALACGRIPGGRLAVQAAGPGGGSEAGNDAASVSSRSASAAGMGSAPFCRVSRTTR